ncbi:MAG: Gfo/Idh/MocA family oxidoreductase [Dongiaceae bacterium]
MAERILRAGLIGCGFFAQNHLHAWRDIPEVELVAVCDSDRAKADAARQRFGVPRAYQEAAAMLAAERLDFVDIVTTMPSHRALVELAAAHRVPAIVQKPFAPRWEDCLAMVEACRRAGVPLMVHENFRFQSPMMEARAVLASGAIGEPYFGRVSFRTAYDVYANQPYLAEEERFILLDLGIHVLDVARVFLGEADRLYCQAQSIRPGIRGEDMATMMLHHRSGATSVVDCSYASRLDPDPFPETLLHLEGTRGSLVLARGLDLTVVSDGRTTRRNLATPLLSWTSQPWHVAQESVLNTQRHWVERLKAGREPETSGADNLRTYALVMAAYDSAASGAAVAPAA